MAIVTISETCTGCGVCIKTCPQMILALGEDKKMYVVDEDRCMSCYGCEDECPDNSVFILKGADPRVKKDDIEIESHAEIQPRYDVIVVGAGPSGLSTAISCSREGLSVAVFERLPNRKVSHHTDGGVLFTIPSATSMKRGENYIEFPELDLKLDDSFVADKLEWLTLDGPNGYRFDDGFKKGMEGYVCSKDHLIHLLADEAERCGGKIFYNTRVKNVLKEDGKICGVLLGDGVEVRSKVVVTADGILGKLSSKTKIPLNKKVDGYASILTFIFERPEGLKSGFSFMEGDLKLDDEFPPALGAVGIGEYIEIGLIVFQKKRYFPLKKPLDYYLKEMIKKDRRVQKYLGEYIDSLKYVTMKGCRVCVRNISKDNAVDGAVAVGDNWAAGGQLGNVPSIANGIYAGREIKKAFDKEDFSKESLSSVSNFISKDVEEVNTYAGKMLMYPVTMDEETLSKYFEIYGSMNYPTFFYGTKGQIGAMMLGFMVKNIFKLLSNPKMLKYM